jgi:Uma2 family endonuclease
MPSAASRVDSDLPDIDDRLVEPETRYEMLDGGLVYVAPADPPHGERHVQLAALIAAHTGPAFKVAADLLTRTSKIDDVAPDVSVYPAAPDPRTGRRQLEQLAFEIVSQQSLGYAARKAAKLAGRGVCRVFAIDVERSRALEWSADRSTWHELDAAGHIADSALEVPLPIEAMVHAAKADDAVARALVARHNPVIEAVRAEDRAAGRAEGKAEGKIEGKAEGKIEALLAILAARDIDADSAARERILRERDPQRIDRWIARAAISATIAEVLAGE